MQRLEHTIKEYKDLSEIISSANKDVPVPKTAVFDTRERREREAREVLSGNIDGLNLEDWDWLMRTMNDNGFEWGHRFSIYFYINGYSKGISKKGAEIVNRAVRALLDDEEPLVDRIQAFQTIYGTSAPNLFSTILYTLEPGRYFPWTKALNDRVNGLQLTPKPLRLGQAEDYLIYCSVLRVLMNKHGLRAQEIDYFLTTFFTYP